MKCPHCGNEIAVTPRRCLRCRYRWKSIEPPAACPRCRSRYWSVKRGTLRRGRPPKAVASAVVLAVVLALLAAVPCLADNRSTFMADATLAAATRHALRASELCRPAVLEAFGVRKSASVTFREGDVAACKGSVAYVNRNDRGSVYVCRDGFLNSPLGYQVVTVLHEELHALGVSEGHDRAGHDHGHVMNRRIIEACEGRSK